MVKYDIFLTEHVLLIERKHIFSAPKFTLFCHTICLKQEINSQASADPSIPSSDTKNRNELKYLFGMRMS